MSYIDKVQVGGVSYDIHGVGEGADVTETTYAELKQMRDQGTLSKGSLYRITDYETVVSRTDVRSAGHPFDVIVLATSEQALNENAWACQRDGDTYFAGKRLEAWELKYSVDNNNSLLAFADTANGKGVIYHMKDENGNECDYDFKNVMFAGAGRFIGTFNMISTQYYYTFNRTYLNAQWDMSNDSHPCRNNVIEGQKRNWILAIGGGSTDFSRNQGNKILGGSLNIIMSGSNNVIRNGTSCGITGNYSNIQESTDCEIAGDYNTIISGENNKIQRNQNNVIISGTHNTITDSNGCIIEGGSYNTVDQSNDVVLIGSEKSYVNGDNNHLIGVNRVETFESGMMYVQDPIQMKGQQAYPVAHPDISTQPSVLPQRFGNYDIEEVLVPFRGSTYTFSDIPQDATVMMCWGFGADCCVPCYCYKVADGWSIVQPNPGDLEYLMVQYFVPTSGYYSA